MKLQTKKYILLFFFFHFSFFTLLAQNKYGNSWIIGKLGSLASFVGDSSKPTTSKWGIINNNAVNWKSSNICDSATGQMLFWCNGAQLFDTNGVLLQNGDHLVPNSLYYKEPWPGISTGWNQSSIILPKGNNQYYVFTPTVSDYVKNNIWGDSAFLDIMRYHVVDMNANNGHGAVIKKNVDLLTNASLRASGLQACRHANGIDWWLVKQGSRDNLIYTWLVKPDTIIGPTLQKFNINIIHGDMGTWYGQACFSKDGTKFAIAAGVKDSFFIADFNRFTGTLSNPKCIGTPIGSIPFVGLDTGNYGIAISPNNQFVYIARDQQIYQYNLLEPNFAQAWDTIIDGRDTVAFQSYTGFYLGPDDRLYIGNGSNSTNNMSVINKPNLAGVASEFCSRCLRHNDAVNGITSPPNMPNYNLGVLYPTATDPEPVHAGGNSMLVYPNPASNVLNVEFLLNNYKNKTLKIYNIMGQEVYNSNSKIINSKVQINIQNLANGVYILEFGGQRVRFVK